MTLLGDFGFGREGMVAVGGKRQEQGRGWGHGLGLAGRTHGPPELSHNAFFNICRGLRNAVMPSQFLGSIV